MQSVLSFTLDSNCIIAIENDEPAAAAIRRLAAAHSDGAADVAIVAIMASENQRAMRLLDDFGAFEARLNEVGLGHLSLCHPMLLWDIGFCEHGLWTEQEDANLVGAIHRVLFPNIESDYRDFCRTRGLVPEPIVWDRDRNLWRNAICDVQAIWSHINARRQIFVTSDRNYHAANKRGALIALGAGRIERPEDAAALL